MTGETTSTANPAEQPAAQVEFRLHVPRDYFKELELILHQSETKFTTSVSETNIGGDFNGYNFDFEDEVKFRAAEKVLEEMYTYISTVRYSPKIAKQVEVLMTDYGITNVKTSSFKIFGDTVRIKSSIKGCENDLNAFFAVVKILKSIK